MGAYGIISNDLCGLVNGYLNTNLLLQSGVDSNLARRKGILYRNASINNRNRQRIRRKKFTKAGRSPVRNKIKLRDAIKYIAGFFQRIERHAMKAIPLATLIISGAIYTKVKRGKNERKDEGNIG
jgi:hypothetical protein